MVIHKNPPKHYLGHVAKEKSPIILIPGILGKWSFMKELGDRISLLGHPVYVIPRLRYNTLNIPESAKIVRELIDGIITERRKKTDNGKNQNIVLVAHSKGGLVGKYVLVHHNHEKAINGLVAIATPFSGSSLTKIIPHKSFKELSENSEIIRELETKNNVNKRVISIFPEFDNHVWSEKGSFLNGAMENIKVNTKGHHKIIFDKNAQNKIIESIEKLSATA